MDTKSAAKRGTASKSKSNKANKKHPLKVVYISNPMKVTASAAEFMALVQRLTGKGAVWPDVESPTASDFSDTQTAPNSNNGSAADSGVDYSPVADPSPESSVASDDMLFQPLDPHYDDVILIDSMIRFDGVDLFGY